MAVTYSWISHNVLEQTDDTPVVVNLDLVAKQAEIDNLTAFQAAVQAQADALVAEIIAKQADLDAYVAVEARPE